MSSKNHHPLIVHLTIIITTITILNTTIRQSKAEICHNDRPLINDDFSISCSKLPNYFDVEFLCKSNNKNAWSKLPIGKLGLSRVITMTIKNCSFPYGLSLFNVTRSLEVHVKNTLEIVDSQSQLLKEHLSGFQLTALHLVNDNNFEDEDEKDDDLVSKDFLYEIDTEELTIVSAKLREIPNDFFHKSKKLKDIEITRTKLSIIKRDDFSSLENLQRLYLFGNEIKNIESNSFDRLLNLKVIDLSKNRLKTLPSDLFRKLIELEKLNISENDFDILPDDLLNIKNSKLRRFRLNHNRGKLQTLPNGFFASLRNLNYTELISNKFTKLPAKLFEGTSLTDLRATDNRLTFLPDGLFEDVALETLYLDNNELTNLSL